MDDSDTRVRQKVSEAGTMAPIGALSDTSLERDAGDSAKTLQGLGTPGEHVEYWIRKLEGVAAPLQLPTDRPRRALQCHSSPSDRVHFKLPTALTKRLRNLARQQRASLFSTLLGSWAVLLGRWSDQEEVLLGTRTPCWDPNTEQSIERAENILPLRIAVKADSTGEQFLRHVESTVAEARAHWDVPWERVMATLQLAPNNGPHLPAVMDFNDAFTIRKDVKRQSSQALSHESTPAFELALTLNDLDGHLHGTLEYACELFDRQTVERMLDSWKVLLTGLVKHAKRPICRLPTLTAVECERVLYRFNATAAAYPREKLIHELFQEHAARAPDAIAVSCQGQVLTYAELNRRANSLAHYLRKQGVGPRDRVGTCFERSVEAVVGVFGVLKSGASYVPLDPSYPAERLAYLLGDASPTAVLTQAALKNRLPTTDTLVISLDAQWEEIAREDEGNLEPGITSEDLAYVMYTSGSTGLPKGVMVRHRNVVNYAMYAVRRFEVEAGEGSLIGTSMSFDLALTGFYPPLLCGRAVRLCGEAEDLSQALLSGRNYAPVKLTPTHLSILSLPDESIDGRIRTLVVGGEPLQGSALRWWREHSPGTRIFNHYGPTETTVGCVVYEVREDIDGPVPIGRPISNAQIYILNAYRSPVPTGEAGEIYIGGEGVAAGYWNRPELTAERFLPDPFSNDPQARMYKTGDLGRWRADGTIEYLGRNDDQLKVRGFRVELGEIGARLVQHAQVKEAVVIAREDSPGDKRLVAYITPKGDRRPAAEILRSYLSSTLPEYMIPGAFVVLDRLPLTQNGKLDRRALPLPDADAFVKREYEAPHGRVEEIVASIWLQLLKADRIGRNDNFFELGGHSLLVVQMRDRLRRFGLSAEVRSIYEAPTLRSFATKLADADSPEPQVPTNRIPSGCKSITPEMLPLLELEADYIARIVATVPGGASNIQDIYPLAPLQEGILFHHVLHANGSDTYVFPTLLSVTSLERLNDLTRALQIVIDRHDVLRTAILWEGLPNPVQVVYRTVALPVEEIALDNARDVREQLDEWMAPQRQSMDIRQAPLVRMKVAADPWGSHWYVILQVHHIASDHESMAKLLREVMACLRAEPAALAEPMPYRNHVARARAYAQSRDGEAFFRAKLADVDEPTTPFGLLDTRGDGSRVDEARATLDLALMQRVRAQAKRLGMSPATLFHAAWALVVSHTSGRDDVVFGTVLLGRMQASSATGGVLGMFINTLPLRVALRGLNVRELVEATQRELVDLLSHEQVSLSVAQRCSNVGGSAPLFSALLNYLHYSLQFEAEDGRMGNGVHLLARRKWTNFPIVVSVEDRPETFLVTAQTDRRVDPRRLVAYLLNAVDSLITALEVAPATKALQLPLLPENERRCVVHQFNATKRAYPREKHIHELFEERARDTPNAIAVTYEWHALTYSELNSRANQLASYLAQHGVQQSDHVVILMERCLAQVIAQLAILKCGAVYVPVDPKQPAERQAFMIEDCGACRVIVDDLQGVRVAPNGLQWINYSAVQVAAAELSLANLPLREAPHRPAYVMYTSGSTGKPKGVIVPHHAVVNLAISNGYAEISEKDRVAYCSNPTFDAATFEVWGALLNGARLVIVPQSILLEPSRFAEALERNEVTILFLTIGLFTQYADQLAPVFSRLRYLMTGGDVADPAVVGRVLSNGPPQHLLNAYGPTECTTISATFEIKSVDATVTSLPIGRPIGNAAIYILNSEMEPVPIGAVGEIYIGGAGVAVEYLHRAELTSQRFLPDVFAKTPGARLYKTGDLGRWREDGNVEFLGRNDQQVKVRGFRVELGEIEAHVTRHPDVKEAVVIAREEAPGQKRLIAYVVARAGVFLSAEQIRDYLAPVLPEHMVPSAFVVLPRLPLTPNGKLDRRALPAPELDAFVSRQYEPPVGEVEQIVAGIWRELLRLERIGRHDHFFELGGHSLLAMQVMVRIRSLLSLDVAISELFDHPVLDKFAVRVELRREELLIERLANGGAEIDELLEQVASMPEHEVHKVMSQLRDGARS
jgi:amino acid adenylation domain-containing protein